MALATPRFLFASDFPLGQRVPLPGNGFIIGTGPAASTLPRLNGFRALNGFEFEIPTPFGPIDIDLGLGCGPLETCSGPTVAGVCLGRCIAGPQFPRLDPGPGPAPPAPPPAAPPMQVPQIGGCPPRAGALAAVQCPSGCHPNKADYFLKGGGFVPKGTRCVRNRRRNPLNPRALDRAMSRIGSAKKAAQSLGRITIRKKPC